MLKIKGNKKLAELIRSESDLYPAVYAFLALIREPRNFISLSNETDSTMQPTVEGKQ